MCKAVQTGPLPFGADPRRDLFAQLSFRIGQQVVESGNHRIAFPVRLRQRQDTGDGES